MFSRFGGSVQDQTYQMLLQWKIRNGKRASVRLLRDVMDSVKPELNLDEVYNHMYSDSEPSSLEESEESEGNETDEEEDADSEEGSELCAPPVSKSGKSVKFQKESGKSKKSGKLSRRPGKPKVAGKP